MTVLEEVGLKRISAQPRTFKELEDDYFDLIITLSPKAHHMALELTRTTSVHVEYWPTPDPTLVRGRRNQILDAYRDVRENLKHHILERFGNNRLNRLCSLHNCIELPCSQMVRNTIGSAQNCGRA